MSLFIYPYPTNYISQENHGPTHKTEFVNFHSKKKKKKKEKRKIRENLQDLELGKRAYGPGTKFMIPERKERINQT